MPKQSKITSSKPSAASPVKERDGKYYCTRCTRSFVNQRNNFPTSQSPMYKENNGYIHVCRHCVEEMYQHYKDVIDDEKEAIKRICLKFDIYWNVSIYNMISKASTSHSRVLSYISKSNLRQYTGKTFDDTLDEEAKFGIVGSCSSVNYVNDYQCGSDDDLENATVIVPEDVVDFWGSGLTPGFYAELEKRYKYWCGDIDRNSNEMDVGERAVIKQICMLEVTINRDTAAGKSIDKSINALNTLLGSANLKPVQKKNEGLDAEAERTPFGVWIKKIENTRPIAEPDPDFEDVDGIIKYISTWFLGHLCKMLRINNTYSRLYEEEMEKLRVARPEYEGEDDDSILEDIFERASSPKSEDGDSIDG